MDSLPTIADALELVLARVRPLPAERVPIAAAHGRVLAAAVAAAVDLPPFRSSAMDGYAVRSADTPGVLRLADRSAAGRPATRPLSAGEAIEISTGAVVPDAADAVVPVEVVRLAGDEVEVPATEPGANARAAGGDVRMGAVVVEAGSRLGPVQVGAIAAAGVAEVMCARVPVVSVLPTGSELRAPGEPLGRGEIYESNSLLLGAQIAGAGARPVAFAPVTDDSAATRAALLRGLDADVLVTSGGVSVGPHDLVRSVLAELGAAEVFWRVAVRPGKPVAFAVRGETLVFGLPGNPVSSLVGFELFVRPALLALQGLREPRPPFRPARLVGTVRRSRDRDQLVRARTRVEHDRLVVEPVGGQASHMIVRAAAADALVLVPRGAGELATGSTVEYLQV